ncbi:hypothetical protein GCK32_011590 [Trichostrongylus colubriformis]|uniref:Uncharacterized protein n=1 Tax=Trichostrongylus colubriformis TaxID=6319 RepID=A0AAN8EXL9_TRICO
MATSASTPKPKGLACPVTLGYPDPGTYEDFLQREKDNAARKKADEDATSCLLLGRDLSPTRSVNRFPHRSARTSQSLDNAMTQFTSSMAVV